MEKQSVNSQKDRPKIHRKILCNQYESQTCQQAQGAAERYNAQVFPKVRVADCLDINQTPLTQRESRYALSAHFDFVVCSEHSDALFAIEYDGPQHRSDTATIERDRLKDTICETAEFPLLRIDSVFLEKSFHTSFLAFLIECWFLNQSFESEQDHGRISLEETFDPICLKISEGGGPSQPVFDIISPIRERIEEKYGWPLFRNTSLTGHLSGRDKFGYCHGLFTVIGEINTFGRGACKFYKFEPIPPEELASIIAEHNMYMSLENILEGKTTSLARRKIETVIRDHFRRIQEHGNQPTYQ